MCELRVRDIICKLVHVRINGIPLYVHCVCVCVLCTMTTNKTVVQKPTPPPDPQPAQAYQPQQQQQIEPQQAQAQANDQQYKVQATAAPARDVNQIVTQQLFNVYSSDVRNSSLSLDVPQLSSLSQARSSSAANRRIGVSDTKHNDVKNNLMQNTTQLPAQFDKQPPVKQINQQPYANS